MVWGPLAGYFAGRAHRPLTLAPVAPQIDDGQWPMAYHISMGVRRDDPKLREALDAAPVRHKAEIGRLLALYSVPQVAAGS